MHIQFIRRTSHRHIAITICMAVIIALVTGCAGSNQAIIDSLAETNEALHRAALPGEVLPDGAGERVAEPWEEPSARIDAFIAAHPDDTKTASALRVRQAMLLLAHKQYHLAGAAFDQATELHSARDKALKALKDELIWWFKQDQSAAPTDEVDSIVAAFGSQIDTLGDDPEDESIRDYLAEMRAWIQLYVASHAVNDAMMAKDIASAMNNYAATLTGDDITAINTGKTTPGLGPISLQGRRQMRAMTVIDRAAAIVNDLEGTGVSVTYTNAKAREIEAIN